MGFKYPAHFDTFSRPALAPFNREGKICLDKNESPFSLADCCPNELKRILEIDLRTYPDPYPLYQRLAQHLTLDPSNLLITYGSEQGIRYCFELVVEPGDEIVTLDPTFAMVAVFAEQFRAVKKLIPYDESLHVSAERICAAVGERTKLIIIANPNNPSGSLLSLTDLRKIAERAKQTQSLLLLDEVYAAYAGLSAISLINEYPNVVVAQSFSKGWGLAGIRVGYLAGQPHTIDLLRRLKPIDEMTAPSLATALLALEHPELLEKNVAQVRKWQGRFEAVKGTEISAVKTHANFILLRVSEDARAQLRSWFDEQRILAKVDLGEGVFRPFIRFSVTNDQVMSSIYEKIMSLA